LYFIRRHRQRAIYTRAPPHSDADKGNPNGDSTMTNENRSDLIHTNTMTQGLVRLGWNPVFQAHLNNMHQKDYLPARVVGVRKNRFTISQGGEQRLATAAGKLFNDPDGRFPVTGDWVMITDTVIQAVLPRKNALVRGAAGSRGKQEETPNREQLMAANLDTVFVVCGLDRDFNLRRLERYITLVYNCSLLPAIILTKADLHAHPETFAGNVESIAFGVPVHLVSAKEGTGVKVLENYLSPGRTVTMIGSSGAGKSTLLNRLYGAPVQTTGAVSEHDGKGKHTTTTRDLIMMPQGGMVIDTPGIREIALWDGEDGTAHAFPDIAHFARECRFSDCSHLHEPGCRVRQAVTDSEITADRLESYHKLKREQMYLSERQQKSADRLEKERWKEISVKGKAIKKKRRKAWHG
jgi:ribosome biogenesis GTPase